MRSLSRFRPAGLFLLILSALLLSSCAVQQEITLKEDNSGVTALSIELHEILEDYLIALAESLEGPLTEEQRRIFDLEETRRTFALHPGLNLLSASSPDTGSLDLALEFSDLARVVESTGEGISEVFRIQKRGENTTLHFHLDRDNFSTLAELFPLYDLGQSLYLFPDPTAPMTEEEYLEYVSWALEGVAEGRDVQEALLRSTVTVRLDPEGRIISQEGGSIRNGAVVFRIPVLRILTLDRPIDLSVTYR